MFYNVYINTLCTHVVIIDDKVIDYKVIGKLDCNIPKNSTPD